MIRLPELSIAPITPETLLVPHTVANNLHTVTRDIVRRGWYTTPQKFRVSINPYQAQACQYTRLQSDTLCARSTRYAQTEIRVYNQTLLTIGHEWYRRGFRVALVNPLPLQDHVTPSLHVGSELGALIRASGITECVLPVRAQVQATTTQHHLITTQRLPIFRTHEGDLLPAPWTADVITTETLATPANPFVMPNWEADLVAWIHHILDVVARLDVNILVMGMWQQMYSHLTARLIRQTLASRATPTLAAIAFAVPDTSLHHMYIRTFTQELHGMRTFPAH